MVDMKRQLHIQLTEAYPSETQKLEDGTQVWSATIITPEETDSVFVWVQRTTDFDQCEFDTSAYENADPCTVADAKQLYDNMGKYWMLLTRN